METGPNSRAKDWCPKNDGRITCLPYPNHYSTSVTCTDHKGVENNVPTPKDQIKNKFGDAKYYVLRKNQRFI